MDIKLTINEEEKRFSIEPGEILLDSLRDAGYTSVKEGCKTGDCGACMVLVDGKAMTSCTMFTAQARGNDIKTVKGLNDELAEKLKQSFLDMGAVQCGFCIPGMLISAYSLLSSNPDPTKREIKAALDGNICRCTGYVKQIQAIKRAAEKWEKQENV